MRSIVSDPSRDFNINSRDERGVFFLGTIIRVGRLIDGTGTAPMQNAEVLVEDGKITGTGPQGNYSETDHHVVDHKELTAIPGMIDLHTHFCYPPDKGFQATQERTNRVGMMVSGFEMARSWLRQGVTTARDLGTPFDMDIGFKELIVEKPEMGPRLVTSGRMMTMTGGKRNSFDHMKDEVTGPNETRRWARNHMKEGADVIKLYCTTLLEENVLEYVERALAQPDDAPDPGRWSSFTTEEIAAVVTEAHKAGRTVAAHASPAFGIKLALRGGVDSVEHGGDLDDEAIELFMKTGATLVPTITVFHHQLTQGEKMEVPQPFIDFAHRRWERTQVMLDRARTAGVKVGTGTDCVGMRDMVFWTEPELLVEVGFSPMEAIQAATGVAAACMGMAGEAVGTLEPGKWADMVLLKDNPLDRIGNIRKVVQVLKSGQVVAGEIGSGKGACDE